MEIFPCDVQKLAELLQPLEENTIINGPANSVGHENLKKNKDYVQNNDKEAANEFDNRLRPEVSFTYSQEVRPEDIFLGLGLRNPSSSSCESLRVTIQMPEEEAGASDIDAQVECPLNTLEVRSPRYKLTLPFPHPVDPDINSHRAKWNSDTRELIVTVRIRRELDYANF